MGSQGTKRKRVNEQVNTKDALPESSKKKKSKKLKESKVLGQSAPDTESSSKQVKSKDGHTQETSVIKKVEKTKKKTIAEEAYSTDTPAERRARKKAAREALMVDDIRTTRC